VRILVENITGDYADYTQAAMDSNNAHFVHMTPPYHGKTVTAFLDSLADKGVVYCASESPVDIEFWIACPKAIHHPLITALRAWADNGASGEPALAEPKKGIFRTIMDLPFV
jgi:hypothetical protein